MLNLGPNVNSLFSMCQPLVFLRAGGSAGCGQLCQMLQRALESQEQERTFGVGADVMGESEESSFITVVGNQEIHLVRRVKERWIRGQLGHSSDQFS